MIPIMRVQCMFFFFNDTATTEIYTLSLHDALPILRCASAARNPRREPQRPADDRPDLPGARGRLHTRGRTRLLLARARRQIGEHTSELQSRQYLVCRLLLEKKKKHYLSYIRQATQR